MVVPDDNIGSFFSGSNVNRKGVLVVREVSKDLWSSDVSSNESWDDRQNWVMPYIEPSLVQGFFTLVQNMSEDLCGKLADPALCWDLAFKRKSQVGIGWQGVDGGVIGKTLFLIREGRDSLNPVGKVTVCVKQLSLYIP
jgi:hypothetical protein